MSGTPLLKKTNVNNKSPRFCSRFYVNLRTGKNRKSHMPVISFDDTNLLQVYPRPSRQFKIAFPSPTVILWLNLKFASLFLKVIF